MQWDRKRAGETLKKKVPIRQTFPVVNKNHPALHCTAFKGIRMLRMLSVGPLSTPAPFLFHLAQSGPNFINEDFTAVPDKPSAVLINVAMIYSIANQNADHQQFYPESSSPFL